MKVVIIEDEPLARDKLAKFVARYNSQIEILAQIESVKETIHFLVITFRPTSFLLILNCWTEMFLKFLIICE